MARKVTETRVLLDDGRAITIRVMNSFTIDDLVIQGMKAEGYRVMTGKDEFPTIGRDIRNYLIKTGIILE